MKRNKSNRKLIWQILLSALFGIYLIHVFHHSLSDLAHHVSHRIIRSQTDVPYVAKHHHSTYNTTAHQEHAHEETHKAHETHNHAPAVADGHHNHSLIAVFNLTFNAEKENPFNKNTEITDLEFDKHLPLQLVSYDFPKPFQILNFPAVFLISVTEPDILTPPPQV